MSITEPGLYDIPAAEYHADPCAPISLSRGIAHMLIRQSPEHAHWHHPKLGGHDDIKVTSMMDDGSVIHELLLGKGHLAAKLNGEQGLVFAQAPFLSDDDIAVAVETIRADNG